MTTGMTIPPWSRVAALYSLQKAMILTPCWPSAGPTGGAGLAWPAGICNLIWAVIFFAINALCLFDLPILQFHRRVAAEDIHGDFQLAALRLDFLDHTAKIQERPVVDLDGFANFKIDLRFLLIFGLGDLGLDGLDLFRLRRRRPVTAHKTDDALGFANKIPGPLDEPIVLVQQRHVHKDVTGIQLACGHG